MQAQRTVTYAAGISLVEVVLAAALIGTSLIAVIAVAGRSLAVSRTALHMYQASTLLEEGTEAMRTMRDNNWTNISSLTAGTTYYPAYASGSWSLSTTAAAVGIFTRTVTIADVYRDSTTKDIVSAGGTLDAGTKLVTVTVSWPEGSTTQSKSMQAYLADIF